MLEGTKCPPVHFPYDTKENVVRRLKSDKKIQNLEAKNELFCD